MRPAFSSTKQAAAFALLLLALLLLPVLMGKRFLPPRDELYRSTPISFGPFNSLYKEIYEDKGDIDIAFIGSSRILHGIDPAQVQQKLGEKLERKAEVITLGWSWAGCDMLYLVAQDLLKNRKVKMLVFTEESWEGDQPHHAAPHLFRWGEDAGSLQGLSLQNKTAYYFASLLGVPENLLALVRTNYPGLEPFAAGTWDRRFHTRNPVETSGAISARLGFEAPFDQPAFSDFVPADAATQADVQVYSAGTNSAFEFSDQPISPLQLHFAREFGELAAKNRVKLVYIHLPGTEERKSAVIQEKVFWPQAMNVPVEMVGIPPAKLFSGMTDDEIYKLFLDTIHFNKNGVDYFTTLITPALVGIYGTGS